MKSSLEMVPEGQEVEKDHAQLRWLCFLGKDFKTPFFPFPLQYDPELSSRQFGVELSRLTSEERAVPVLVEKLINYIEMHGLYTEGIYRKSGSTNKIKELRQGLDTGKKMGGAKKKHTGRRISATARLGVRKVGCFIRAKQGGAVLPSLTVGCENASDAFTSPAKICSQATDSCFFGCDA